MLKKTKETLKPELKLGNLFDLRTIDTNILVRQLEENIKLREMPLAKRVFKNS